MISERIQNILDDNGIGYNEDFTELEYYTSLGEDFSISLDHDGTDEDFIREFTSYAEDFDPEDHAAMYIVNRGKYGIPNSIQDLLTDANEINEFLERVALELHGIKTA